MNERTEKRKIWDKKYRSSEKGKTKSKEYYLKNKIKIFKRYKEYCEKNKNKLYIYKKEWCNKNKLKLNKKRKIWRHNKGISIKYQDGHSKTKLYKKIHDQRYLALREKAGELTIQIIQQLYEDNIKQYGTLTCYLCLNPIEFGQDSLEHKIPLCRGGTNIKDNLDIAHIICNSKKKEKTEQEYKKLIQNG